MTEAPVIVTGATGFLGGALSRTLLKRGQRVIASGRQSDRLQILKDAGAEILHLDLSGPIPEAVPESRFMVHCAALSSPWGRKAAFVQANELGTQGALAMARAAGVQRFVHISTPSLYFKFADQDLVREDTALPPAINAYAETKRRAEDLVMDAMDLDPIILRPRGIYGRGDVALLPRLLHAAAKRPLPLMRGGKAATDLTHVDDVVGAITAALEVPNLVSERIFNVSGGAALPIRDVVDAACAYAGIQSRWRPLPFALVRTYAHLAEGLSKLSPKRSEPAITAYGAGLFAFRQTLDISKAQKHLEWYPSVTFEEGLARTFDAGADA